MGDVVNAHGRAGVNVTPQTSLRKASLRIRTRASAAVESRRDASP